MAVPALFPFFVAGALLTDTGVAAALGRACAWPLWKLYGLPGEAAGALVLGLTGGYPVGVQAAADLYAARTVGQGAGRTPARLLQQHRPGVHCGRVRRRGVRIGAGRAAPIRPSHFVRSADRSGFDAPWTRRSAALCRRPGIPSVRRLHPRWYAPANARRKPALRSQPSSPCLPCSRPCSMPAVRCAPAWPVLAPACRLLGMPADAAAPLTFGAMELTRGLFLLPEAGLPQRFALPIASILLAFGGCRSGASRLALPRAAACR